MKLSSSTDIVDTDCFPDAPWFALDWSLDHPSWPWDARVVDPASSQATS